VVRVIVCSGPLVRPVPAGRASGPAHTITRTITQIQLLEAPEDGPVRSETCRAAPEIQNKASSLRTFVYLVGIYLYILLSFFSPLEKFGSDVSLVTMNIATNSIEQSCICLSAC
jgi:hypothetical protein